MTGNFPTTTAGNAGQQSAPYPGDFRNDTYENVEHEEREDGDAPVCQHEIELEPSGLQTASEQSGKTVLHDVTPGQEAAQHVQAHVHIAAKHEHGEGDRRQQAAHDVHQGKQGLADRLEQQIRLHKPKPIPHDSEQAHCHVRILIEPA
eukprot:CAMPEP_0183499208 /NCGR_PEP_ID=MMETSP0371-20130417/1455_1 /TAXON_ID=268820 /ORGANISM="Peridinium aciculiferum, Strain PAER-2" /LENGTH=147 /DNA_ID=CAMNT_0025692937 /DNA_START=528 /DNA_END=972 /DNA_ORIENTATION=+